MKKCVSILLTLCLFAFVACTATPPTTSIDAKSTTPIETTSLAPSPSIENKPEMDVDLPSEEPSPVPSEVDKTQYESLDITEFSEGSYDGSFEKVYFTGVVLKTSQNGKELLMNFAQGEKLAYCKVNWQNSLEEYEPGNILKIYGGVTGLNQDMSYPCILIEANLIETIDETAPVAETYMVLDAGVETEEQQQEVRNEAISFDLIAYWMDHSIYDQKTVGVTGYVTIAQRIGEDESATTIFTITPQNVDAAVAVIAEGNVDVEAGDVVTVYGSLKESEDDEDDSVFTGFIMTPTLIDVLDTESE